MRYRSPPGSSRSRADQPSCPSPNERCPLSRPARVGRVLGIAQRPASRPHSPRTWRQECMQLAAGGAPACREWTLSSRGGARCAIDAREVRVTMVRRPAARWIQRQGVERELDLRRRRVGCRPANCGCSRFGGRKRRPGHRVRRGRRPTPGRRRRGTHPLQRSTPACDGSDSTGGQTPALGTPRWSAPRRIPRRPLHHGNEAPARDATRTRRRRARTPFAAWRASGAIRPTGGVASRVSYCPVAGKSRAAG